MINIALCDDQDIQLQYTDHLLREYLERRKLTASIHTFSSGAELLSRTEQIGPFDLFLIDVMMPEMNGIETGIALRKMGFCGLIIYLASSPDLALESYEAHAFHYLIKPVDINKFSEVMDEALSLIKKHFDRNLMVKTKKSIVLLPFNRIKYTELKNRCINYCLCDGSTVTSVTLTIAFREAMQTLLADPRFQLCGASFLVNLRYIKMIEKDGAVFFDDQKLTLPKSACSALRKAWSGYWMQEGNPEKQPEGKA